MRCPLVRHAIRRLLGRSASERDLDDELRFALDELTERYEAGGLPRREARRAAAMELGGVEQLKEGLRDIQPGAALEAALRDGRYALRSLGRAPAFTVAIILTLGLGIGGAVAIFSIVNTLLLRPLPYRDAERLVFVWQDLIDAGYPRAPLAGPELEDLRLRSTLFDGFGGIWATTATLTGPHEPEGLRIGLVTPDFFHVLGADAALGRTFTAGDQDESGSSSVLLGWPLFQRRFAGDPAVIGRRIDINQVPATVVGVMPEGFRLLLPPDASVPDHLQAWQVLPRSFERGPRTQQFIRVVGRMKPAVDLRAAQEEIERLGREAGREHADYGPSGARFYAVPLHGDGVQEVRPAVLALLGGVVILLLIACVNVASLLVTRAAARAQETALRIALGATSVRLVRQCAVEGFVIALLGGVAGLIAAGFLLDGLLAFRPAALQRAEAARIDLTAVISTLAVVLGWAVLFSLAPLAETFKGTLSSAFRTRGAGRPGSGGYRLRTLLVGAQLALSVVLLVGAALLTRSFVHLQRADVGFSAEGVLSFKIPYFSPNHPSPAEADAFSTALRRRFAALPGIRSVGAVSHVPYDQVPNWGGPYLTEGQADPAAARVADTRSVTPGFFETVGATFVEGRDFTEADTMASRRVAIVDNRLAERTWRGESAVGKRLRADPMTSGAPAEWVTIVGVVRHLRHRRAAAEMNEQMYFPLAQAPRHPLAYVLRTDGDPAAWGGAVRAVVAQTAPQLPVFDMRPLGDYVRTSRATARFTMLVAGGFAAVALLLACVGVYGLTAYAVSQRRQEIGVRMALGATAAHILRLVVRDGSLPAAAGIGAGLIAALAASMLLERQLIGVRPYDPVSIAACLAVLVLATAAATWLPARKALRTDPLESLRTE